MKSIFFAAALLVTTTNAFSQQYAVVQKVNKKCAVVSNEEGFYGLEYNKKLVQDFKFEEFENWGGLINFYSDSSSVCWNDAGKKILEFTDAKIFIGEGENFLFVDKAGETALYTAEGKEFLPFGKYEFEIYENGILVKNETRQQAFFDGSGNEIIPFENHEVSIIDDYENVIGVLKNTETTVLLNDRISAPYQFSKLTDFTFVQDHEVTVEEYLYFLGSQQYDGYLYDSDAGLVIPASRFFPDTTKVETKLLPLYRRLFRILSVEDTDDVTETNVTLPGAGKVALYISFELTKQELALAKFPVTGITKEQAEAYCQWLSMHNLERTSFDESYDSYSEFRLPTSQEWENLALQGLGINPKGTNIPDSLNKEKCMMFIYDSKVQCKNYASYLKASRGGGAIPALSVPVDFEGRHHVFGNVAEMTSETSVAKGGSYIHSAAEAGLDEKISYSEPQPWLGFRIVGEYHY